MNKQVKKVNNEKFYSIDEIRNSLKKGIIIKPKIGTALKEYLKQREQFKVLEY